MRAVQITTLDGPTALEVVDVDEPAAGPRAACPDDEGCPAPAAAVAEPMAAVVRA